MLYELGTNEILTSVFFLDNHNLFFFLENKIHHLLKTDQSNKKHGKIWLTN